MLHGSGSKTDRQIETQLFHPRPDHQPPDLQRDHQLHHPRRPHDHLLRPPLHHQVDSGRETEQVLQDVYRSLCHVPGRQISRGHPTVH